GREVAGAGRGLGELLGGVEILLPGERRHREVVAAVAEAERLGLRRGATGRRGDEGDHRRHVREQVAHRVAVFSVAETPQRRAARAGRRAGGEDLFGGLAAEDGGTDDAAAGAGVAGVRRMVGDRTRAGDARERESNQCGGDAKLASEVRHAALLPRSGPTAKAVRSKNLETILVLLRRRRQERRPCRAACAHTCARRAQRTPVVLRNVFRSLALAPIPSPFGGGPG